MELFEVLLFIDNVKKITICEVHKITGELVNFYSVETTMTKEDEVRKQAFRKRIKQVGTYSVPSDIPAARVSYVLNISDTFHHQEKWLIVEQVGFQKAVKKSIVNAFERKELGMLPRGGVACILEKNSKDHEGRGKKAYCFLPLPFETDLPVHINAHFALDHEARRNLWRDEGGGYRSDWNKALLGDVVASCYLTLLIEVRAFLKLPVSTDGKPCTLTCSEGEVLQSIKAYESFFPLKPLSDSNWETLVDSLYAEMASNEVRVLPVVRNKHSDAVFPGCEGTNIVELNWFPPVGKGKKQVAFFNDLAETGPFARLPQMEGNELQTKARRRFEEILIESGFNLVAFSLDLHKSLTRSGIRTCTVTPSSVVDFYKSFTSRDPLCEIGSIPCNISETPFRNAFGVILVLLYCKEMRNFADQLPDLPLLLTQDDLLRLFSSEDPKFLSRFQDILPGSPHIFVHVHLEEEVFNNTEILKSSAVRSLDVDGFSANLTQTLEVEQYGKGRFVEWSWNQKHLPNQQWISRVWIFLSDIFSNVLGDESLPEQTKSFQIKSALAPLANWSILPATESKIEARTRFFLPLGLNAPQTSTHLLVPLCESMAVLDYRSSNAANNSLMEVLKKFGLPELNYTVLSNLGSAVRLAPFLVCSLKVPSSLLTALHHKIERDPQSPKRLDPKDCKTILEYFSRSVACLHEADKIKLRKLPFFLATHGGFAPLDSDRRVCVLPVGIPRKEIENLECHLKLVFIESWAVLSNLFKFLDLECVSDVDVYCTYILPTFNIFSQEGRLVHLDYIRKYLLSGEDDLVSAEDDVDNKRLRNCLETTPFIPSLDGTLQTASSFYDPDVDVFRIILPPSNFPLKPLNSPEWLMFFRTVGLIHKVSRDHFMEFAREVAHEATTERTKRTFEKSRVLVKHLLHRHNVVAEGLVPTVSDIPFVSSEPVRKVLRELCLPYQGMRDYQIPFCTFKGAVPSELVKLPTALRPKMLSSLVKETISSKNEITTLSVEAVNSLKHKLSCPQFIAAIVRLIRDENQTRKDINHDAIANVEKRLRSIDVCVVENLRSVLLCDGSPIPGSQKKVSFVLEKSVLSNEERWNVYLDLLSVMNETFAHIYKLSDVIVDALEGLLGNTALMVPRLLDCHPGDMSALLDALDVRPDDSYVPRTEVDIFPKLGTFIPLIDHHLLNDAFEEFEPGEYIGFELEDPTLNREEGVPTYIYARVVREVSEKSFPLLTKRYKIDIGGGQELEVDVADLYKFHRLSTLSSAIAVFERQERSPLERPRSRNLQEVLDEISKLLEVAWKLPEEKRRKIVKRLYLQRHPDKNVGDEEFCTEVCKHIQSETSRLKRGEPRGSQQSPDVGSSRSQRGFYDDFFHSWEARAREHSAQREGYRYEQKFPRNFAKAKNPQPGEARRWLRQARADIAATENDIVYQRPSYEWACFKCHQVS